MLGLKLHFVQFLLIFREIVIFIANELIIWIGFIRRPS